MEIFEFLFSQRNILFWGVFFCVILSEHFLLTHFYKKPSSLVRLILQPSSSTRTDHVTFIFYYIAMRFVRNLASLLTLPGLAYIGVKWLQEHFELHGLFGVWMPEAIIPATIIWLIVYDFPSYLSHWMMHKFTFLWRFHKLHHAATEMNVITGIRLSIAEHFLNNVVHLAIASVVLGLPNPGIAFAVLFVRRAIDLVQHSDLPWDYGALGYIVASPRYHRLHHSNQRQDFDRNYGNIFSFWDFIFGTASRRYVQNPSIADTSPLGLANVRETENYNNWRTALFIETWAHYAFLAWRAVYPATKKPYPADPEKDMAKSENEV
jgi:sterol desaturase/sphingolipid hydroxylase (fatty acid hydroxylase superfamily)